jgi:hypothetical protein
MRFGDRQCRGKGSAIRRLLPRSNLRYKSKRNTRALCVLPFGHKEANMDNTTLLIIIILVVILLGGGWYGRGRWF